MSFLGIVGFFGILGIFHIQGVVSFSASRGIVLVLILS